MIISKKEKIHVSIYIIYKYMVHFVESLPEYRPKLSIQKPFINFVYHTAPHILIMQNFKIHNLCFEKKRRTKCFIKSKIFLPSQNYNDNLHEKGKPLSTIEQSYIG